MQCIEIEELQMPSVISFIRTNFSKNTPMETKISNRQSETQSQKLLNNFRREGKLLKL